MNRRMYRWVVLGITASAIAGCQWGDIGSPDDMASRQEQMRRNRGIPTATEMPPGLGEDLPITAAPAPAQPVSNEK